MHTAMPLKCDFKRLFVNCIVLFLITIVCFNSLNGTLSLSPTENIPSQNVTMNPISHQLKEEQSNIALNFQGSGDIQINSITLENIVILKGENAKVTLDIESEININDISVLLVLESIPSQYGLEYFQDRNNDDELESLKLEISIDNLCSSLDAHVATVKDLTFGPNLDEGIVNAHSLQPLNRGSWKFNSIQFISSSGDSSYEFEDNLVVHVAFNPDEHVIFAYFTHNNIPTFYDGRTIRDSLDQAVDRLKSSYLFNYQIEILFEDNGWSPDSSLINNSQMIADAWAYVGKQLQLKDDTWDNVHDFDLVKSLWTTTKPLNGGYDILIAVSDRPGDALGIAGYAGNWAYTSGGRYNVLNYHTKPSQYDNIIQHEISHVFGASDRANSGSIMDTQLTFNGTHYTSPCLEETHYIPLDITQMKIHAERFDGPLNPTIPYTLTREKILSTADNTLWIAPKIIQSKNTSHPILHSVAGLKNSNDKIVLYYSSSYNDLWSSYTLLSIADQNASSTDIAVDAYGNLHVVWIVHNSSTPTGHLYYRNRTALGSWGPIDILETNTTWDCKISVDSIGNVFLIYAKGNDTFSELYYRAKNDSNWSDADKLDTDSTNARKIAIHYDHNNNLHLFWHERNSVSSENKLYYNILDNGSSFGAKKVILTENSDESIENLQLAVSSESGKVSYFWEAISESQRSLYYTVKHSNGTLGSKDSLFSDDEILSTHYALLTLPGDKVTVFWEDLNKFGNQTYLLFRSKTADSDWSYTNRYSLLEISHSYPSLYYDSENDEIHFMYSTNDYSYSYDKFYSRIIDMVIYPENYQISVVDFNFTAEIEPNTGSIIFSIENIQASSNFSNIGILDELSETFVHSYGVMRKDKALPLKRGNLDLNTYSDTWYCSDILTEVEPGEYYVVVAFMDNEYIYSGQFKSQNVFVIEEPETGNDYRILIITLSIGIPVVLTGIILPIILVMKKRKKLALTAS